MHLNKSEQRNNHTINRINSTNTQHTTRILLPSKNKISSNETHKVINNPTDEIQNTKPFLCKQLPEFNCLEEYNSVNTTGSLHPENTNRVPNTTTTYYQHNSSHSLCVQSETQKNLQHPTNNMTDFDAEEAALNARLIKFCQESEGKFKTEEELERYRNEDGILNKKYIPAESKLMGETFLRKQQEQFAAYSKKTGQPYGFVMTLNNAEFGNSCFKTEKDQMLLKERAVKMNPMVANIVKAMEQNGNNGIIDAEMVLPTANISYKKIRTNEYYLSPKHNHTHIETDQFVLHYEKYKNKDVDDNPVELDYTDCYDFKEKKNNPYGLLSDSSSDSSSEESPVEEEYNANYLKESYDSFDNLESTEKKYEEILRDFNGKIPLLHKILKEIPLKNRSNNFDICLYLLQRNGGELTNDENVCILRDKDIVKHSALYDSKRGCLKARTGNVTNVKLFHPKWYSKKHIIERMKEQSSFNPFTIFGSAPSLLDFGDVFDQDVYNKFVSRNSRKTHHILRALGKQKVIANLGEQISDKEWPQVQDYLKKKWSKETNLELNWTCDPLLYEELEWYLSTNNQYLNMTDRVADIEVCYCPTLNPESYYAWNDSRVIYTNLCYNNNNKEEGNDSENDLSRNLQKKKSDCFIRKRASGCEHTFFANERKKLKKKKKKLRKAALKKKKKLLEDARKNEKSRIGEKEEGNTEGNYESESNNNNNNNPIEQEKIYDPMNNLKNVNRNNSVMKGHSYDPKTAFSKKFMSPHRKMMGEMGMPISPVNMSLYRQNMDNGYNCANTASEYIKNKDNTFKYMSSPMKYRKSRDSMKRGESSGYYNYGSKSSRLDSSKIRSNNFDSYESKNSMSEYPSSKSNSQAVTNYGNDNMNQKSGYNYGRLGSAGDAQKMFDPMNNERIYQLNSKGNSGTFNMNRMNFANINSTTGNYDGKAMFHNMINAIKHDFLPPFSGEKLASENPMKNMQPGDPYAQNVMNMMQQASMNNKMNTGYLEGGMMGSDAENNNGAAFDNTGNNAPREQSNKNRYAEDPYIQHEQAKLKANKYGSRSGQTFNVKDYQDKQYMNMVNDQNRNNEYYNKNFETGYDRSSQFNQMVDDFQGYQKNLQNTERKDCRMKGSGGNMGSNHNNREGNSMYNGSTNYAKRISNSNNQANPNRKIRKFESKNERMQEQAQGSNMREMKNSTTTESSTGKTSSNTNTPMSSNNKQNEMPSSRTSETSISSAFRMATSVFKKLF